MLEKKKTPLLAEESKLEQTSKTMIPRRLPTNIYRRFSVANILLKNSPKFDDAELLAGKLTTDLYKAKRSKEDFQWSPKSNVEAEKEYAERMEKFMKLSAAFQGLLIVVGLGVASTVYMKWPQIKGWWLAKDFRLDDDAIEQLKKHKHKKALLEIPYIPEDQKPSSVPGLYYWGADGRGNSIKFPTRVPWFNDQYLRDVALSEVSPNLAIDAKGNLLAWDRKSCDMLLPGQDLVQVKISNDVAYALNKRGQILVIPLKDKFERKRNTQWRRSWLMPWKKHCHYRWKLSTSPCFREKGEKMITQYCVGKEHLIVLSNVGKAYVCATGVEPACDAKSRGQFGVPTLSQFDQFPDCNELYEIELLNNAVGQNKINQRKIVQIACGDHHTLARDSIGELYSFGLNTNGQLGQPISYDMETVAFPKKVGNFSAHFPRDTFLKCADIHCSGNTSYVSVVPQDMRAYFKNQGKVADEDSAKITYFSFGIGIHGELGNGHFKHSQSEPTKVKILNDTKDSKFGGRVKEWACGENHVLCKLENGNVVAWGSNDKGQLGNGKRIKSCKPFNIPKLLEPGIRYSKDPENLIYGSENFMKLSDEQSITAGGNSSCIFWKAK